MQKITSFVSQFLRHSEMQDLRPPETTQKPMSEQIQQPLPYRQYNDYEINADEVPSEVAKVIEEIDHNRLKERNKQHHYGEEHCERCWGFSMATHEEEREQINAAILKYGLVKPEFRNKHSNLPPLEEILNRSGEPFKYGFDYIGTIEDFKREGFQRTKLNSIKINAIPLTYDPAKQYRIDAKDIPPEVVMVIETGGRRLAAAERDAPWDTEDLGITIPTYESERKTFHAAMLTYGLIRDGCKFKHGNIPPLEQIIKQSAEPFHYYFSNGRLEYMEINVVPQVYDPTKPYRVDIKEMPKEVIAEIESLLGPRRVVGAVLRGRMELGQDTATYPAEQEIIHAAMLKHGIVNMLEYYEKHKNLPSLKQIISKSSEPFHYGMEGDKLLFIEINPVAQQQSIPAST